MNLSTKMIKLMWTKTSTKSVAKQMVIYSKRIMLWTMNVSAAQHYFICFFFSISQITKCSTIRTFECCDDIISTFRAKLQYICMNANFDIVVKIGAYTLKDTFVGRHLILLTILYVQNAWFLFAERLKLKAIMLTVFNRTADRFKIQISTLCRSIDLHTENSSFRRC